MFQTNWSRRFDGAPLRTALIRRLTTLCTTSFALFALTGAIHAQIQGQVFQDSNGNGLLNGAEVAVKDVIVTAYFSDATSVSTTTNTSGAYTFTAAQIPAGTKVRIEFTGLPAGFQSGPRGTGSGTTVQFVTAPSTSADLGAFYPCEYCQENPRLIAATYYSAALASFGPTFGTEPRILSFDYANRRSPPQAFNPVGPDTNSQDITGIGNVQAFATQRRTKRVFIGAMASSLWTPGSAGIGQIYLANYSGAGSSFVSQAPFVNLSTFAGVNLNPSPVATNRVGEYGIGGLAVSEDDTQLFAINMGQKTIEMMTISIPASTTPPTSSVHIPLPTADCGTGSYRANAITTRRNRVVVGGVCDTLVGTDTFLKAYVYEYNINGLSAASVPVATHSVNLDFAVNSLFPTPLAMIPWSAANVTAASAGFQPMVTGIGFVDDGAMILGIMPRVQYNNAVQAAGFTLRLAPSGATYARENAGVSGAYTSSARDPSTLTANPGQSWPVNDGTVDGPGGDWFFEQGLGNTGFAAPPGPVHPQLFSGGITVIPGTGEAVFGVADPVEFNSWGVRYMDWATGQTLYGHITGSAKAAMIGDVEALCDVASIELGNRLWRDTNGNGLQDADEPGIGGATVRLFDASNALLATAVSDATGAYYFVSGSGVDSDITDAIGVVNGAIAENANYQIRIDKAADFASGGPLANTVLSPQNVAQPANGNAARTDNDPLLDIADSDASLVVNPTGSPAGSFPVVSVSTSAAGHNNHSIDFGFVPLPNVSGRVYLETGLTSTTDDNPTGSSSTVDPGQSTQVSISCTPANAYSGAASVVTGTDGRYSFDSIVPGAVCVITESQPAGYTNAYNTPGAGGANTAGGSAGTSANGVITVTVPISGSPGNNFAQQSADMRSSVSCAPPSPTSPGAQLTCTVTCTNDGPGTAVSATCSSPNGSSLAGYVPGSCPLATQDVANGASISCNFGINAPSNGIVTVQGATSASNDRIGGSDTTAGNNPSNTQVSVGGVNVGGRVYVERSTPNNTTDNGNVVDPGLVAMVAINCTAPSFSASMSTGSDGGYLFSNVPAAATCTITETQPSGYSNAYTTAGATTGAPANPAESVGSVTNGVINIVVPNTGSLGNNFAEQSADMVSSTVCTMVSGAGGAQANCTVTCTNNGPGIAANAFCSVPDVSALPGRPVPNCSPTAASLASGGVLTCTLSFALPAFGVFSVSAGTGAVNDANGGNSAVNGNNPSSAAVGTPHPVSTTGGFALGLLALLLMAVAGRTRNPMFHRSKR
jgi:SdrD B-like domain